MGHDNMMRCKICKRMADEAECKTVSIHSVDVVEQDRVGGMDLNVCAVCFPRIKVAIIDALKEVQNVMKGESYWKHTDADKVET